MHFQPLSEQQMHVHSSTIFFKNDIYIVSVRVITPSTFLPPDSCKVPLLKFTSAKKKLISENIVSEVPLKNFFISQEIYASFWRYSVFCIFSHFISSKIFDVMIMSILTYLLYYKSLDHETWSTNRYSHKQYFQKIF